MGIGSWRFAFVTTSTARGLSKRAAISVASPLTACHAIGRMPRRGRIGRSSRTSARRGRDASARESARPELPMPTITNCLPRRGRRLGSGTDGPWQGRGRRPKVSIIRIRPVLHAGQRIVASVPPPSSQGSLCGCSMSAGTGRAAQPSKRRQVSSFSRR